MENIPENSPVSQKTSFLQSMVKAEKVSQEGSAVIDQMRGHALKHLTDLDKRKRNEEAAIAEEIKRKQEEIEEILRKKKEEEQLKRLEFAEEKINEENEGNKGADKEKPTKINDGSTRNTSRNKRKTNKH